MKNLMTRKLLLGTLMAFVLAFSVQGVCEALDLTARSNLTQTKQPTDPAFEIQFSVGLTGNTIAYDEGSPRRRVEDDNDLGTAVKIDSQGYRVYYATNGTAYRYSVDATNALTGTYYVDPRPTYNYKTLAGQQASDVNDLSDRGTPTKTSATSGNVPAIAGSWLVNSGRQVYDATGKVLYTRTGAGTRAIPAVYEHTDGNGDNDDDGDGTPNELITAAVPANLYVYTLVDKYHPTSPEPEADRFDYNEEAIAITSVPAITGDPATGLKVTVKGYNYRILTGAAVANPSMWEGGPHPGLPSSITLLCDTQMPDTYVITITDATPEDDYPINEGTNCAGLRGRL